MIVNLKTDNFTGILNYTHQQVREKMEQNQLQKQAQEIQTILREIKKWVALMRNPNSSAIVSNIHHELADLIEQTFQEQVASHSSLKSSSGLFRRSHFFQTKTQDGKIQSSHGVKSISGYDDIFQEQLDTLLKTAAKMKGISTTVPMIQGQQKATSAALEKLSKEMETKILDTTKKAAKELEISVNRQKNAIGTSIVQTTGKVDLKTPYFNVSGDASSFINRLLMAFSGHTFTLKNYATYTSKLRSLDEIDIHLGDTQIYKAVTGGLSEIYSKPQDQHTIYFRGMTILSGESENPDTAKPDVINQHFAHLRFMYELRGSGLLSKESKASAEADFIIWNDPSSENIIVRSTRAMVAKYIDNYKNAFSAVDISASLF